MKYVERVPQSGKPKVAKKPAGSLASPEIRLAGVKGVLLDVDGTLVLSNDAHALAWVEAFAHHGHKVDFETVRPLMGMGGDKVIPYLFPGLDKNSGPGKNISSFRSDLFANKYVRDLRAAPGSRELIQHLQASGLKLKIASSSKKHELGPILKAGKVDDLLQDALPTSNADDSKPDPDIVGAALDEIGLSAPEVLMIGDTPYDIEAAKQCGIGVIAVRCGGWSDKDLAGAIAIYDDPADLLAHYGSSPLKT